MQALLLVFIVALFTTTSVHQANSKQAVAHEFGEAATSNVFPTKVDAKGWDDAGRALTQDLDEHSLYQSFSAANSAHIGGSVTVEEQSAPASDTSTEGTVSTPPATESTNQDTVNDANVQSSAVRFGVFAQAGSYPLLQLTLTSSTPATEGVTPTASSTTEVTDVVATSTTHALPPSDDPQITLENFDTAGLEKGQILDGIQLRVSFAAHLKALHMQSSQSVDVYFGTDDDMRSVGSIVIDDEVSNAINGGYYLFALPTTLPIKDLTKAKVVFRYHGDKSELDGMYLDAAWLQMNTRVVTEDDLKERGAPDQLTQLEAPKLATLESDKVNFDRTEDPVFNLRYESQQNFIVRNFLKMVGKGGLSIEQISVNHDAAGHIDVTPKVTITDGNLVSIEIPKDQLEDLPPGSYQVNILYNENGLTYTDTFDFEWGILSLNPNKTEYQVGETAHISMAALSTNGNTLCDAHLNLYVTDPSGAVTGAQVIPSDKCQGNNVTDVPDYTAEIPVGAAGEYKLYLERVDDNGAVIGYSNDGFTAVETQSYSIERTGPTRIYPRASYPMQLTVTAKNGFHGVVRERVPASFVISTTTADITQDGTSQVLSWPLDIPAGGTETVKYYFDAPDISPYLYNLGEATLESDATAGSAVSLPAPDTASSTASSSATLDTASSTPQAQAPTPSTGGKGIVFTEHRKWQIASDATGSMLLMWAGANIPTGWTCVSCVPGDVFYQKYIVGSSTAGLTGGAANHTHTASGAVAATTGNVTLGSGGGVAYPGSGHTHTYSPTIGTANNLPSYRNLVIIQNNSAGEPTSIPAGAITVFDAAVPSGWTRYAAQDGYYTRGESAANRGTTGGSNTHTHTITGTTGNSAATVTDNTGGATTIAQAVHNHTVSLNTAAENSEPPFVMAIYGQLNSTTTLPNNAISMWTDTPPTDWNTVSGASGPFENRFVKASSTYGTTGGASTHTPANVSGASGGPSTQTTRGGAAGSSISTSAHTHTINVTAFTSASILPTFRTTIFAKRAGGQPPAGPTITSLFDNEKTGTSTPSFNFKTDDPVGTDSLIYEFMWSTSSTFTTTVGDRTSDVETGCSPNCFINTVTGGDTSPFNENENIKFTIQTALTDGTTYYWRTRAKKSTGTTWGSWSATNSFTYISNTSPSQWLQTMDAQFSKDTFSNTETYGADKVRITQNVPKEVMMVYAEAAATTPKYRIWNGTSLGAQANMLDVAVLPQWVKTAAGTARNEYGAGTEDTAGAVKVQIYNGGTGTWGNLQTMGTVPTASRRGFDLAYETKSGKLMVVYCSGTDAAYRTWDGTTWSAATTITTVSANNCNYVALTSNPTSNDIIMVTRDTGAQYEAQVWNGSTWANSVTLGSMNLSANIEGIAAQYEESGNQGMVVVSNGTGNNFLWTAWNGTEWSTPTTVALFNDFEWGDLKHAVGSDKMTLCYIDRSNHVGFVRWDGDAWSAYTELDTAGNSANGKAVSCEYETSGARAGYVMMPYSDTTASNYRYWDGTTLAAKTAINNNTHGYWESKSVRAGDGKILTLFNDDVSTQYDFTYWNGTSWAATTNIETNSTPTATPFLSPLDMAAKIYQPSSGTVISTPVDFSSVSGQKTWGEATWSTTEPSGTDVKLQVLYATSTNSYCNVLVPNAAFAGNSIGFDATTSPLNLSGLSTTTYNRLCLKASLTSSSGATPTLNDWNVSWIRQPYLVQSQFKWYANANWINPSDPWPAGGTDLAQNAVIPQVYATRDSDIVRLRMNVRSDHASLSASKKDFKLQYSEVSGACASSTSWFDVGAIGSTTAPWRGYNNTLAFDGSTISTLLLGSSVGGTYEEENNSALNPNAISTSNTAEWDWVLQQNGAVGGVQYCFRMVTSAGVPLDSYEGFPSLTTNSTPIAPTPEKLFDNEQVASTSPWLQFSSTDADGDDLTYEVQVDDTYDFSSTVIDRNSLTNFSEFENTVVTSDKDPFTSGQTVRFKPTTTLSNNTTYYWRVRAKDVNGSNLWGSWSQVYSFTVNTGTTITTWYQTTKDQFNTDSFANAETSAFDDIVITTGFTTATATTNIINYNDKTTGNAWGSLSWNQDLTHGSVKYYVEYLDTSGNWSLVPNSYLPGNSSGFTSSPVSLLGLDPLVHTQIRVRANLTDVGGTPRVQNIKVDWGYAVEQPTQTSLFDNEKTGTTTPTFTFKTNDPQSDDIQYEFSYSTSSAFTSSTTKRSGVNPGFTNTQNGVDTSPFFSGNKISYKIQTGLVNGTTYYWKVRGRDPSGGNAWSVWSATRSFTVDTAVTVSTWFQTTDPQFQTDSLSSTEVSGTGGAKVSTTIREAMTAYAEGTVQSPRYRIWDGTTWGSEGSAVSVGGSIRFVETAASKTRDEYVMATQEGGGRVRTQVYNGSTASWGNLSTLVAAVPSVTRRGFDIAYENTSGKAMVAACSAGTVVYSLWDGSTWSTPASVTLPTSGNCNWVKLAASPKAGSNEIIMVVRDVTTGVTDYDARVWNGTSWGNATTMTSSMSEVGDEGIAVEYEESGTDAVVVESNGNNASFVWKSWNGTAWSAQGTQALSDDFEEGKLTRDVGTDNMAFCLIDNLNQTELLRWTGSTNSWNAFQIVNTASNGKPSRSFDCPFETNGSRDGYIMVPYTDTVNALYSYWNGSALTAGGNISSIQDSAEVRTARTGDGNILATFYDDATGRYDFSYWNGTIWSSIQTLESVPIVATNPTTIPIAISARRYPTFTSGSVYSTTIDFDNGSGLKWQQMSFSDTKPGASTIKYYVEYFDGSNWQLVPNTALTGNSSGFTTSPVDISGLSHVTYNQIRLRADLACVSGNCPTLNDWTVTWAAGINVSGTLKQYNETSSTTSGTIAVAVNGTLQAGKTATVSSGNWTIPNVTAFEGDIVTVFVNGAANSAEAVGVTRYDGDGDITGFKLFERHLSLGSNEATTTPITNTDISKYDFTNSEDLFADVTSGTLKTCADVGCSDAVLYIRSGTYYSPGGRFVTHDFRNLGKFTAGAFTDEVNGSWFNSSSTIMTGSTLVFAATSSTETIDSTGAVSAVLNNVTLGTTTGSGVWTLGSALSIAGNLTVSRGTLSRAGTAINISGNLANGANGVWSGVGTTTLDGASATTWQDSNSTLQNFGKVVVDGTSKLVTLASNVKAQSLTIGANDTFDLSTSNYTITDLGNWYNQNNFLSRSGTVNFAATTTNRTITSNGKSFYNVTFTGAGSYSFTESTVSVGNDWSISAGTVTLPTATSTIAGSFTVSGGNFAHNNGTLYFTAGSAKTITFLGGAFTNVARNMTFNGTGSWTITDTNATSTNDVLIQQGTVKFPNGVFAIGGKLTNSGGSITAGGGTAAFYATTAKVLTFGGAALKNVIFNGSGGSWSFTDTNATINGNLTVSAGTPTFPAGTLYVGGSYTNSASVVPGTGTVEFSATSTGKTLNFGSSALYNVNFNSGSGGWTVSQNATTTNNMSILAASNWTLASGKVFSVGNVFNNAVANAATTWTGSTLALRSGTYTINAKSNGGDTYNILSVASGAKISMWNSSATTYNVNSAGYLYSEDHNAVDGNLYIFGAYTKTGGNEYWKYNTDFDGTALGTSTRQANVKFASGASATFTNTTVDITGISTASTTIANQGSGTYTVNISGGTLTAQYYQFTDLGGSGVSLLKAVSVSSMNNGSFTVGAAAGSALTISSTTINAAPAKQITGIRFATSTAITAKNVSQTDGTPTSFWWFKSGYGNLYGEAYDNDTGDPGSIRFDDSHIVVTISGTVYSDAGVTPLTGGTCNGSAQSVKIVVNGGSSYTGSCSAVNGSYSIAGVTFTGDPVITIFLDNASGGQKGSVVTRTVTANVTNMDIYANRVIVRHEDVTPLSITNMSVYDFDNDTDLRFVANGGTLKVLAGNELYVWKQKTFTPAGLVTLYGNAGGNSYDGSLSLGNGATFNAYSTTTLTVGGRIALGSQSIFNAASTTVLMNATTSGKSITATSSMTFYNLTFNGSGGSWNLGADITANNNIAVTTGTVTGTGSITLPNGSLTGNGTLSLGAGTTTIAKTTTLGGTSPWTFFNLKLGNGTVVGTTTPASSATTTVSGKLTISAAHVLNTGSGRFDLAGTGTVFVNQGTFVPGTGTVRYSGAGSNILSTTYYNLDINSGSGSQSYTAGNTGILINNNLTVGGTAGSTLNLNSADPVVAVNSSVTIRSNGTLSASDINTLTISGGYTNSGTFTSNNGTVVFNGTGSINAGASSFGNVKVATAGTITMTNTATATVSFKLLAASGFTLSSGQTLAVGGAGFLNAVNGSVTTWTGSTLRLYGGSNYNINPATSSDSYGSLAVKDTTQARMWSSDATSYIVDSTASLYSQDHANTNGDLYIFGAYKKTTGNDYWSYATDFDGSALGGSPRKVNVKFASGASATYTGGSLWAVGAASASTTITNQGAGTYGLTIGGSASTTFNYYQLRNMSSTGIVFTGTPNVVSLSFGDIEISQNGFSGMTVGGTAINANPAKNFNRNRFALNGASSGTNVTATGTTVSAWRFTNHYGGLDGEAFDSDPGGDPGYISWDNSASNITISGKVYSDEGATVSSVCDGVSNRITLRMAGLNSYSTSCNASTGAYSIPNVPYGSGDSFIVYIDNVAQKGATVSQDPVSNIGDMDVYENRVIVRHENIYPLAISDMAVWDSNNDADIPFTTTTGSPNTLTLPANRKLIVWSGKTFAPAGNVTLSGGGAGASYDGTLELFSSAKWTGAGTESLTIGGSFILDASAQLTTANGTTTFTTTGASRTIDLNNYPLFHAAFTGSGSWSVTDPVFNINGNMSQTAGTLTLPTGTSTFNGSVIVNGGTINTNGGKDRFTGTGGKSLKMNGSSLGIVTFAGGNYIMLDTNATSTGSTTIQSGTITLPSGVFSVGRDFKNTGGSITHNSGNLVMRSTVPATLLASSSSLNSVRFAGATTYTLTAPSGVTFAGNFIVAAGTVVLPSATVSVGGNLDATGGTLTNATTTFLFNASASGKTINPGNNNFYAVQISAPSGGYTLTGNATTTNNFTIASVNNFTQQSGKVLRVAGVFQNSVGGAATTWNGTLKLDGANAYTVNTKSTGADRYNILTIGANTKIRMWGSNATTTTVNNSGSLYSQNHASVNGYAYIYGNFQISTSTEYWNYTKDFDGTVLGSPRAASIFMAANATTTLSGGSLQILGASGNSTTIANQGSGTYAFAVTGGALNAQYYAFRNLNASGLNISGTPSITSLSNGDFELAVNNGTLITLTSGALNANASLLITGNRFATTTAITGKNVTLSGTTANAWTFTGHTGNLAGEAFDVDGGTACGSIRWSDSSCLITQQTHYRWRNDDNGTDVPNSEWYNTSWASRKSIDIDNADATTYSNAVVQTYVTFDADMRTNFGDLRFTDSDGVTPIPYWIGSSTDSTRAEVWLKVPSLPSQGTARVYMYFNNPTATTTKSMDNTFLAADDFNDGNITEYSGQTGLFNVRSNFAYGDAYGLDSGGNENSRTNTGGIYNLAQTVSQGETYRFKKYIDTTSGAGDEACAKFGIQSPGSNNHNYAICFEQFGVDRISLAKNVVDNETSGTVIASSSVTFATGWYETEVKWKSGGPNFTVNLYNATHALVTSFTASDSTYTSGGIGFSYWFHYGGWDDVGSRPILTTEPTTRFGAKQGRNGATWKTAEDTLSTYGVGDIARLRVTVENSGTQISGQQFRLDYAPMGAAASCEAVGAGSYAAVPIASSCGTAPVCMKNSSYVTDGSTIADLLLGAKGTFTAGKVVKNTSNKTGSTTVGQNQYTELEYAVGPTSYASDANYCFRVTNNGSMYDTYLKVPRMGLKFDPIMNTPALNGGQNISLLPGTTTRIYATTTVTDFNGYTDLRQGTSTIFRTSVGANCTPNNNNCYRSSCTFTNCSGNSCTLSCYADIQYFADPTDGTTGTYSGQQWSAFLEARDYAGGNDFDTAPSVELTSLSAFDMSNSSISYPSLQASSTSGTTNASTTLRNIGNTAVNTNVLGTDMTDGVASTIPAANQRFATSTFNYNSCTSCKVLSNTTPVFLDLNLPKPTSSTAVTDKVYWGIKVPFGVASNPYHGTNTYYVVVE